MSKTTARRKQKSLKLKKLAVPGAVMLAFWTLAAILWQATGEIMALFFFGYIGTSVGVGLGLYAALPKSTDDHFRQTNLHHTMRLYPVLLGLYLSRRFRTGLYGPQKLNIVAEKSPS